MAAAAPSPQSPAQPSSAAAPTSYASTTNYETTVHNIALACLVVCPVLIAVPPRKLDLYTAVLGGATILSANRLHKDYYDGQSIGRRFFPASTTSSDADVDGGITGGKYPTERAKLVAQELKRRRDEAMSATEREAETRAAAEEEARRRERGVLEKAWYGSEDKEDWNVKREREVQAKFAEGKGFGDIIMDQIWEVINWGQPADGKNNGAQGGGGSRGS